MPRAASRPQQWITTGTAVSLRGADADDGQPQPVAPPTVVAFGKHSTALAEVSKSLLADGTVALEMMDYPDLKAATVRFLVPNGDSVSVAAQQMRQPIAFEEISQGSGRDILGVWDDGTQYVLVKRSMPLMFQVVAVSPNGLMVTVTVQGTSAEGTPSPYKSAGPDELLPQLRAKLADPHTVATLGFA